MPKHVCIFLLIFAFAPKLWAQQTVALTSYFTELEISFNCTFSYEDAALQNHIIQPTSTPEDLQTALALLTENTLFDFRLLEDKTVTVTPKGARTRLCYTIKALDDNSLLEGAEVITDYQRLLTDSEGRVRFDSSGTPISVQINFLGYASEFFVVDPTTAEPNCAEVYLDSEIETLSPVMLTNFIAKGISKQADGAVNINYDAFDILPGLIESDVLLTVKELPGIQSVNETVSFLNIRGGTNDQNLILWDGIKMYQSGHFFGLISAFNPNLTKEVDVYKSVANARFGDGVSGVISMRGQDELVDSFKVNAGLNLLSADALIEAPITDKLSLEIAGRYSLNSLINTPTYETYFDKAFQNTELQSPTAENFTSDDDFKFFDAHLRLQYEPTDKDKLRFSLLRLGNRLDFLENATIDNEPQARTSNLRQDNLSGGLFYSREWNDELQTQVQWYGSGYELIAVNADVENDQRLIQENDLVETGIKIENSWRLSDRLIWQQGYQFNETGITNFENINNPTFERLEKQVLRTNSLFSSVLFETTDKKNRLNVGLRANHINKFDEILLEPRVHYTRRFGRNFTLEVLGALNSQTTSQIIDLQNDFLGVENRRWVLANPGEIPIIKGRHLGLGLSYSRKGLLFSFEPYIKEIKGITSQSQGFQNQFEDSRSHGEYTVYGLDFLANKQWENANIWISYSYAQNDYLFPDFTPSEFANNLDIRHNISLGTTFVLGAFNLGAGLNWHSGKPFTPFSDSSIPQIGQLNYDLPNSATINPYFRVDASATYTYPLNTKATLVAGLSLWNLLDNDNVVNTFFRIDDASEIQQVDDLSLRFTPNATLRVIFK